VGDGDGRPMIVTFATCTESIRTIPILQHDPDRPEDVMTDRDVRQPPANISRVSSERCAYANKGWRLVHLS
jgi:hypothetical protein